MANQSRRSSQKKTARNGRRLPANAAPITVTITHIGGRGDGVGKVRYSYDYNRAEYSVFTPYSLPGETVIAQPLSISKQGIKARILEVNNPAPFRQKPRCNAFPTCGGCSFQHWAPSEITTWKHKLIESHLDRFNVAARVIYPALVSPDHSRRRATFHIKRLADTSVVGFYERNGTHIVDPDGCTIIDPGLTDLKTALVDFANAHFPIGACVEAQSNILSIHDELSPTGLCLYMRNTGPQALWTPSLNATLCKWAASQHLARLSVDDHGTPLILFAPSQPMMKFGTISVTPPPGAFLQATKHGECALQKMVVKALNGHKRIADLFAGCGTLSLPLVDQLTELLAVESDSALLDALKAGVDSVGYGGRLTTKKRNLFGLPLLPRELAKFTGVILNPPRNGAIAQCQQLAQSDVMTIAMASCNPASFARDAACLTAGGYNLEWIQPVDQFIYSNHMELVGTFSR